jgi:pimeloyl-ACP methyl ester carboxylesterase
MRPGSRNPSDSGSLSLDPRDRRVLAWITAPEAASAHSVLDLAFAELRGVRQDRPRRWSPLVDALSRPVVVRLPRWIWIALALLLATAVTVATLVGVERLRLLFDRLTELPAVPAQMSSVACSADLASAPNARCLTATLPVRHERPEGGSIAVSVIELGSSHAGPGSVSASSIADTTPVLVFDPTDPRGEQTRVDLSRFAAGSGHPVVAVSPRSTDGATAALACPAVRNVSIAYPNLSLGDAPFRKTLADAVRSCRQAAAGAIDLDAYSLAEQAADLESVRLGLGIDRWIVRARGREARIALELGRRYPSSVAGLLLVDPVFGPYDGPTKAQAFAAAVRALGGMCANDSYCTATYVPPKEALARIEASLPDGVTRAATIPSTSGADVTVAVDAVVARAAVREAMAGYTTIGIVPSALDRSARGDLTWVARSLIDRGWCLGSDLRCSDSTGWSGAADFAMSCDADEAHRNQAGADVDPLQFACAAWVDGEDAPPGPSASTTDIPTLAIVADVNPTSTPSHVREALAELSRSNVVEVPWTPEGLEFACVRANGADWLSDPGVHVGTCPDIGVPAFADAP